jgi:hypothetical protein
MQVLDVSHVDSLRRAPHDLDFSAVSAAIVAVAEAAQGHLIELHLDGVAVTHDVLKSIGRNCKSLRVLSIIGCKYATDSGLGAIASGCPQLESLSVGGPGMLWSEGIGLTEFKGLRRLTIARRSAMCTDNQLFSVLQQHPELQMFRLCMSSRVTDEALRALPPKSLRELHLVCCEGVQGMTIARLRCLEILRLSSCPNITDKAVQVSLTRLMRQ